MSIPRILKAYLDHEKVHYDVLPHPEAFRAVAIAQTLHTPEKEIAKVVIVKVDQRFMMMVLPASWNVDLHRVRRVFATHQVRLATEEEIKNLFPDCELGAMPPFGQLYGLPVYVDQSLVEDEEIIYSSTGALADIRWAIKRWVSTASVLISTSRAVHDDYAAANRRQNDSNGRVRYSV